MAATEADICNRALLRVGQKRPIASLGDATTEAQLCAVLYPQCRDEVLSEAWWPFAAKHATLAAVNGAKRTGWAYVYALPGDCLRPRFISNGSRPGANILSNNAGPFSPLINYESAQNPPVIGLDYSIAFTTESSDDLESEWLLTDQASAELIYTAKFDGDDSVPRFPPLFVDALAWKLAAELAFALPVKKDAGAAALQQYQMRLKQALAESFRATREDRPLDAKHVSRRG